MRNRTIGAAAAALAAALALLPSGRAGADEKTSIEARARIATDIVVGVVSDAYSRRVPADEGTVKIRHLIEVQVAEVEKGSLRPGDVLYVRAWRKATAEKQLGRFGHEPIPEVGARVRALVVRGPYEPGGQDDNGWSAVYPNGFVLLGGDGVGEAGQKCKQIWDTVMIWKMLTKSPNLPADLSELEKPISPASDEPFWRAEKDPWGSPYRIEKVGDRDFRIRSDGPDRQAGTADDIAYPEPDAAGK